MRKFSLNGLLIAVSIFALVLAACGPTPTEAPPPTPVPAEETPTAPPPPVEEVVDEWGVVTVAAGDPIKVGFAAGLSGAGIDVLGLDELRGAELAVKDKPEVLGFPVELQVEDAMCSAEGGQTVATKFVADPQIVAVLGHMCSSSCVPASQVYEQNGYVMVSPSCTGVSLTAPDTRTESFNRVCWNDKIQGPAAAGFVYETLGVSKVATVHDGSPYAEQLGQEFTKGFEALGGEIVAAEAVNVGDTDMRPVLTRIKAAEPELIYFSAFVAEGGYMRSQMADVGMEDVMFMGADGIKADEFIKAAGDASEGVYASAGDFAEAGPALPAFLEAYEAEYGEKPIAPFHAHAYDAYMVIVNAIEQVGVVDADGNLLIGRKALRDAIRATKDYQGLSGKIACDENGDCGTGSVAFSMVTAGAWVAAEAPAVVAPAPEEELNFILVQHALCAWDSFWCTVEQGIADGAEDIGVNVTVLGPDEFNLEKTATLIDQAVAAQPDGIALTVTDPVLFKEPIMRALDAGIPVLAYNAGSGPIKDGIPYLTYLGQDEYQGGYQGGLRLAAEGGTKGVCINQQVGHTGLDARCQGFVDALDEKGIPAEVLAVGDDLAESQTIIDDYFTANPDVDIALTLGPNGATPFYAFLDAAGLGPDDVTHGTFDLNPEIVAAIENGTSMFGIDQQPFLQGYGAVMMLMLLNRQNIVPALPVTATGPGFVDKSNVAIVKALAGEYR